MLLSSPRISRNRIGYLILLVILVAIAVPPVIALIIGSFSTAPPGAGGEFSTGGYSRVFGNKSFPVTIFNTLVYALGASVISLILAFIFTVIVERTNTPFRRIFPILILTSLGIPYFLVPIQWILLLDPNIGLINGFFKSVIGFAPFTIYGIPGMVFATGISFSFGYLLLSAAFRRMDPAFEEAALISGAKIHTVFYGITAKIMVPALLAVFLIEFIRVMQFLDTALVLGVPEKQFVLSSRIFFNNFLTPPDFASSAVLGVIFLFFAGFAVWGNTRFTRFSEKYTTITGRDFKPKIIDIGKWRWPISIVALGFLLVTVALPIFIMIWASFQGFYRHPSFEVLSTLNLENYRLISSSGIIFSSIINTLILAIVVPTLIMVFTSVVAWFVIRVKMKGGWALDFFAFLPIAVPGIVLALGMIWLFASGVLGIFGTLWILVLAFFIHYMPYGIRWNSSAVVQIHRELEEVSRVSGASSLYSFFKITFPLLKAGLITGWIYISIAVVKELSLPIMLASPQSRVFTTTLWEFWQEGALTIVAAYGTIMTGILLVVVIIYIRFAGIRI
ncbi:MAG: iron ABC transporter permease [Thaumarchaeota archaeon]|nr:iron ABC transporter permease [Nitrososphaerota archaeon]